MQIKKRSVMNFKSFKKLNFDFKKINIYPKYIAYFQAGKKINLNILVSKININHYDNSIGLFI